MPWGTKRVGHAHYYQAYEATLDALLRSQRPDPLPPQTQQDDYYNSSRPPGDDGDLPWLDQEEDHETDLWERMGFDEG